MFSSKNKATAISNFADSVIRYSAAVVSWKREDLKKTDIRTRKLITMHGVFHSKSSTVRVYTVVSQEEQILKFYVSRKARSDTLMAEYKRLIVT